MTLVIVESPYKGSGWWPLSAVRRWLNVRYARRCVRDSLMRGEAPIASHLLYTQPGILRDWIDAERAHGIQAGLAWSDKAALVAVYTDRGITSGMEKGIAHHRKLGKMIEVRSLSRRAS